MPSPPEIKLLIADDEPLKRSVLQDGLSAAGYQVTCAADALEALEYVKRESFDVIVTDLRMPGKDGLSLVRELRQSHPDQAILVMTAYGTVETAVEAMKLGAFDYLQKPFATEELLLKLDKLVQFKLLAQENVALRRRLKQPEPERRIVGRSDAMRQVMARVHAVAATDATVLIEGESGTGKELVAREIHLASPRCRGPFVAVACAALPRDLIEAELFGHEPGAFTGAVKERQGRFELAHGGTLFLDDIDDVPLEVQVKLVRVLQERVVERVGSQTSRPVDVRILAATKKPLAALVAAERFREDLYYRLNVVPLRLPPLRERAEDIGLLAEYFLEKFAVKMNRTSLSFTPGALERLSGYRWPGNVRELEHTVERIVALTAEGAISADTVGSLVTDGNADGREHPVIRLSLEGLQTVDMAGLVGDLERQLVQWAIDRSYGNLAQAAQMLGVPRSTLQYKVQKFLARKED